MNVLLPQELQGARYSVCGFQIQPEVSVLNEDGVESKRFLAQIKINVFASGFDKSLRQLMIDSDLKMDSGK